MIASESSHFRNFHIPYIEYLQRHNTLVYTASNGEFEKDGVVHTKLNFKKKITSISNIGVIVKLARLIRRERFDAVYTNSTLAGAAGRAAAILSGVGKTKCIHICHGYLFSDDGSVRSKLYLAAEKLFRKRTEILAVMNREDLEIARKYSLGKETVFLNGMGFDPRKFPEISEQEISYKRKELGGGNGETLFLCVGEFSRRKNQTDVIKACAKLKRTDYRVIFAGDGVMLEECKKLSEALGLSDKIKFHGHCTNINLLYRSCDYLVSASRSEGLPFNVMEALFCGENIIVSAVKGNIDLVGKNARSYPFGDIERLSELMEDAQCPSVSDGLPPKYLLEHTLAENISRLQF